MAEDTLADENVVASLPDIVTSHEVSDTGSASADGQCSSKNPDGWEKEEFMHEGRRITIYKDPELDQRALQLLLRLKDDVTEFKVKYYDDVFEEWAKRKERHQDLFILCIDLVEEYGLEWSP